jgi:hypothetical protein
MSKNGQFPVGKPGSMNTQKNISLFMNTRFQLANSFLPVFISTQPIVLKQLIILLTVFSMRISTGVAFN